MRLCFVRCAACRTWDHHKGLWMANISNTLLCFTHFKALFNTVGVKIGWRKPTGFKVG
jgi:hypothetical protein